MNASRGRNCYFKEDFRKPGFPVFYNPGWSSRALTLGDETARVKTPAFRNGELMVIDQNVIKQKNESKRSVIRALRFSDDENKLVDQKCDDTSLSFSDLVRYAVLNARPPLIKQYRKLPDETQKLILEISKTQRRLVTIRNQFIKRRVIAEVWNSELADMLTEYKLCMSKIRRVTDKLSEYM